MTGGPATPGVPGPAADGGAAARVLTGSGAQIEDGGEVTGARSGVVGLVLVLVVWAYVAARLFTLTTDEDLLPWYAAGLGVFLLIQLLVLLRRGLSAGLLHLAFALQCAIVLLLLAMEPERDFVTALFVSQCYQAAVVFAGRTRLVWVAALEALIGVSLVVELGALRGLSLALIPMAGGVVLATFVVVGRELETARAASQRMVTDLQAAHRQLEVYAGQADELAAIEARSRVAHELDESVSRTLSEVRSVVRAVRPVLGDPDEAGAGIERLQTLTQQALAQMRRIIAELRPSPADSAGES